MFSFLSVQQKAELVTGLSHISSFKKSPYFEQLEVTALLSILDEMNNGNTLLVMFPDRLTGLWYVF